MASCLGEKRTSSGLSALKTMQAPRKAAAGSRCRRPPKQWCRRLLSAPIPVIMADGSLEAHLRYASTSHMFAPLRIRSKSLPGQDRSSRSCQRRRFGEPTYCAEPLGVKQHTPSPPRAASQDTHHAIKRGHEALHRGTSGDMLEVCL